MAVLADGSIQAHYPKLTEVRLLILTVGECVATRAHESLVRVALLLRAYTAITLRAL